MKAVLFAKENGKIMNKEYGEINSVSKNTDNILRMNF
jgi:hypothetical protein